MRGGKVCRVTWSSTSAAISVDEFNRMAEVGIFDDDERLELIDGELIAPPPMGPRHAGGIRRVNELLVARIAGRATVGCQVPMPLMPYSEPLPDFVIARFDPNHYAARHPSPEDVLWVIELGDASRAFDRNTKFPLYARHGVRETWLLDFVERRLLLGRKATKLGYSEIEALESGATVAPDALPDVVFAVDVLLGPSANS